MWLWPSGKARSRARRHGSENRSTAVAPTKWRTTRKACWCKPTCGLGHQSGGDLCGEGRHAWGAVSERAEHLRLGYGDPSFTVRMGSIEATLALQDEVRPVRPSRRAPNRPPEHSTGKEIVARSNDAVRRCARTRSLVTAAHKQLNCNPSPSMRSSADGSGSLIPASNIVMSEVGGRLELATK